MAYPEYLMHNVNTSNPGYQLVQQFNHDTGQARDDAYARMYAQLQAQQAKQAQAQALALQQQQQLQAQGGRYTYTPYAIPQAPAVEPEAPGFLGQVFGRAVPETLATFQGAGAAVSAALGAEGARDYFLERAQANFDLAQKNAPRQVGRIEDIEDFDSLTTWATETAADLLPSIVGTVATGGAGGIAALGAAGAKGVATAAIKGAVKKTTQDYIKKGMSKELAEQTAKTVVQASAPQIVRNYARTKGMQAGVFGFTAGQGTGSAYNENVRTHGVEEASPLRAMGVGAVQGLVTSLMGMETSLLKSFTGVAVGEAKEQTFKRALAQGMLSGAFREGGEETLQELTQVINNQISDDRLGKFTPEDISSLANSMAAGMLFGAPAGGVNSLMQRSNAQKNAEAPTVQDEPSPITTPEQRRYSAYAQIQQAQQQAESQVQAKYEAERGAIMSEIDKVRATMVKYGNSSNDPKVITMASSARSKILNKAGKDYANLMASLTRIDGSLEGDMAKARTEAENALKKVESEYITDSTIAQSNQFWSDPEAFTQLTSAGQDAIRHVARQNSVMSQRVNELSGRIADVRARLNSPEAMGDFRVAKALKQQESVLKKELGEIRSAQIQLNNAGVKISNMLSKPDKNFTPQKLDAELAKVYTSDVPISLQGTLADSGTFSAYDSARNIIQEDTEARAKQAQEAIAYMQGRQNQTMDTNVDYALDSTQYTGSSNVGLGEAPSITAPASTPFLDTPDSFLANAPTLTDGLPIEQTQTAPVNDGDMLALPPASETISMGQGYEDMLNQAEIQYAHREHTTTPQDTQYYEDFVAEQGYAEASSIRPALPESGTTGRQGFNPTPETGLLEGTTNAATRIHSLIQPSLKQLNGLGRATIVADTPSIVNDFGEIVPTRPGLENIPQDSLGAYDPNTNSVILFAENIYAEAARKSKTGVPTSKDIKDVAVRTLVHEGVVHYGLSILMNNAQRTAFLKAVNDSFKDHPLYKQVKKDYASRFYQDYKRGNTPLHIAEEFLARYAEQNTVRGLLEGTKGKNYVPLFKRVTNMLKSLLKKLGITKVTEEDVMDVLKASSALLSKNMTYTVHSSPLINGQPTAVPSLSGGTSSVGPNERQAASALQDSARPVVTRAREALTSSESLSNARDSFMEKFVDAIHPVKKLIDEVKNRDGGVVDMSSNLYKVMQSMPNIVASDIKQVHAKHVVPLLQHIADITPQGQDVSLTYARVADYATAKAALERNLTFNEDGMSGKGWTNAEAQAIIDNLASPEMDRALALLQGIHEARLQRIEKNVLLPKEQTDAWRAKYQWYMPLKAWESILQNEAPQWYKSATRRSVSLATRQDRTGASAKGSDRELDNAVTHSILQLYDVIGFQHNAETGRSLLSLINNNPDFTDLFEIEEIYVPDEDGDTSGIPRKRVVDNEGNLRTRKLKSSAQLHPNKSVVVIDPKGNKIRVIIHNEGLLKAIKGENVAQLNGPMQTIANIRRNLGMMFTVYNPTFWVRNPIRDTMTAILNIDNVAYDLQKYGIPNSSEMAKAIMQKGLLRMGAKSGVTRALRRAALNGDVIDFSELDADTAEYMKHYSAFVNYGAKSSYFSTGGYEKTNIDLLKELRDMKPSTKGQAAGAKMRALGAHMEAISDALENQTRYIAFVEVVNALKQAGMTEPQAYERAANIALNLTVNFSKKGAAAPIMDALWMFSSANIAGNARLLETILRKDKTTGKYDLRYMSKYLTYPALAYFAQAMLARELMPEDEDGISMYDKIPDYVKANNIIIPTLDGAYITIPVAYGLNVFWNMARNINDSVYATATGSKGPSFTQAASDIISASFDNFSPMGSLTNEGLTAFVPTIFRPLIQLNTNQNFAGNPIYPDGTNIGGGEFPDSQKAWTSTGPVYKMLAEGINELFGGSATRSSGFTDISPETIEHLMGAYLGGVGRLTGQMLNDVTKLVQGDYTGGDFMKIPGLSAFVRTQQPGDTTAIYYKARTELQTQINTVNEAKVNPSLSTQEKIEVIRSNQAGVRMKDELNRAQKQLNDLRSKERTVGSNTKMSEKMKRAQLEQLQNRRLAIMKRINKRALELGVRIR